MEEMKWADRANCQGTDTNHFFTDSDSTMYMDKQLISRICSNCEVIKECHDYSLRYNVLGWWANTSEKIRRDQRRQLNIIPISIGSEGVYE